jgi:hypothetical protein
VELEDVVHTPDQIKLVIKEQQTSGYRVQFIGKQGRLLKEAESNPAIYSIRGDEGYVRSKVIESNGQLAWTQPVMVSSTTSRESQ